MPHFKFLKFAIPITLGILFFYLIVGLEPLNPENLNWIFGKFDPPQHYLGWVYYRASPWSFPLGDSPKFGMEIASSIVYTDSIPLMAIIFKAFSPHLPEVFQYLGIWLLICFILQVWFAWKVASLLTNNIWIITLGAGILAFAPPMLWRVYTPSGTHAALASHFLILAAFYLILNKNSQKVLISWLILLCTATLIHFYLFAIISALWIGDLLDRYRSDKKDSFKFYIVRVSITIIAILFCGWQAGYFAITGSSGAEKGYGFFKLNLLSPIDPNGWSHILPTLPIQSSWGEGFNYLGLGVILLIFSAIFLLIKEILKNRGSKKIQALIAKLVNHRFVLIFLVILLVNALTSNISIGTWEYNLGLPSFLHDPLSVLRSSARMYWPIHYALIIFSLYLICVFSSLRSAISLLALLLLVQIADTRSGWSQIKKI